MHIALLADIHGNLAALDAVLADIESVGPVDQFWVLGDLAAFCPEPARTLERLASLTPAHFISGNTDRYLVTGQRPPMIVRDADHWARLPRALAQRDANFRWTVERLSYEWYQFLHDLPQHLCHSIPGFGEVLAVHASPRSDEEGIFPDTTDAEIEEMLAGVEARLVVCGHTHLPLDRQVGRWRVINPGSLGLPFDGDQRAAYVLLEFGDEGCQASFRRAPYDVEGVIARLEAVEHPARRWVGGILRNVAPPG